MDWLTTCVHHSELHFADHWHIQTSVLCLIQCPLAVSWQRLLPREILQLPALRSYCHYRPCRTRLNCQPSTNWVPGWRPFHTNLLVFFSHADFQLTTVLSLANQLLQDTSLNWTADNWLQLGWYPWGGPNRKHRLQQSLKLSRVAAQRQTWYRFRGNVLPTVTKQSMFLLAIVA
jgi:hypothetical protein